MLEWLPSRLLVLSFSVFGDFDKSLEHLTSKGMTLDVDTGDFLEDATDAAVTCRQMHLSMIDCLPSFIYSSEAFTLARCGCAACPNLVG